MIDADVYEPLPCGADPVALADQVAEGRSGQRSPHQVSCPWCGAALDELDLLWGHIGELRAEKIKVPDRLVATVMRRIRSELAQQRRRPSRPPRRPSRGEWHPLTVTDKGTTWLPTSVVAQLAVRAAARTAGVVAPTPPRVVVRRPPITVEINGHRVRIELSIFVERGRSLIPLAQEVRQKIIQDIAATTGLQVTQVNLTIAGISAPSTPRVE